MTAERKQSGPAIAITLFVLVFLYPLSTGPVIWLAERGLLPKDRTQQVFLVVYAPICYLGRSGPEPVRTVLHWWERFWTGRL
jgi:hypothetical protein